MNLRVLQDILPTFNALCNTGSALCIILGFYEIRRKNIKRHRNFMVVAFAISMVFLVGYLTRYALAGHTAFRGEGTARTVYFIILTSHTILAVINLPLVITSLILGFRNRIEKHKKLVRFTLPIWLYVSITGVVIYFMLYRWYT